MTASSTPNDDGTVESSTDTTSDGAAAPPVPEDALCRETVDPETRSEVLEEDKHRCQYCGRTGPSGGGIAMLHVHHIERSPEEMDEHDLDNLTTLCRVCHEWHHQRATRDEAPVEISDADLNVLLAQDIEILQFLNEHGPASTGDVVEGVTMDLSVTAVRERLWSLMGLDNVVESRDRQIVDQDVETGAWGLTEDIVSSARGHIPDDPQLLWQRIQDEQVRRALDAGCDRRTVMRVLSVSRRTTFHKEKRANAYDFPLDAFDNRGGRPVSGDGSGTDGASEVTGAET